LSAALGGAAPPASAPLELPAREVLLIAALVLVAVF
jgi:hypothetical protein